MAYLSGSLRKHMLTAVHRCSSACRCYADVHIWARNVRVHGGDKGRLKEALNTKALCHQGKHGNKRIGKTLDMSWTEIIKNINHF